MIRILLIDDDEALLGVLEMIFTLEGYEVSLADSGLAALELARSSHFDVAFTDLRMPGMSGIETLAALKKLDPMLPVIVISAHISQEAIDECRSYGAFDFLRKPFDIAHLRAVATRAIHGADKEDGPSTRPAEHQP